MRSLQRHGIRAVTAWVFSLLLIFSPLLARPHLPAAYPVPAHAAGGEMPCHMAHPPVPAKPACPHCEQPGLSLQCDCCDNLVSPSLLGEVGVSVGLVMQAAQTLSFTPLARPEPPPTSHYRPPILA